MTTSLLHRVMAGVGACALVATTLSVAAAAGASGRARAPRSEAGQLSTADSGIVADRATAELRLRLASTPDLEQLAGAVRFEPSPRLSALTLADDAGAVSIAPRATTDGPSRATVDIAIDEPELLLWTMGGGRKDERYPPSSYAVARHPLDTDQPSSGTVRFGSTTGRSSRTVLPLFLVTDPSGTRGYWFAIGWSGSWQVTAHNDPTDHHLRFELPVGGRRGPDGAKITMGTFSGDGWGAIKRYLQAISRDVGPPAVVANTWFAHNTDIDESKLLADIPVAARAGAEVYTVDAGWYSKPGLNFSNPGLGTWTVDRRAFPHGLEPVIKAIRAHGMRPGLWFEPERAWRGSALWMRHPDWVLREGAADGALVDFGNPKVQRWALNLLDGAIERYGLEWIKWDFNMDPAPMWKGDAAREVAHLRGVYTVMEELRSRHPEVLLEMCAGGGNRIDSEMIRRADAYWLSDQTKLTDGQRLQSASAARVLPARYRYTSMAQSSAPGASAGGGDALSEEPWLTAMSGTFGIMEPFAQWSAPVRQQAAREVARFKDIRHLLDGNVRIFRDDGTNPARGWEAWEFSDPDSGEAALFSFRQQSSDEHRSFDGQHHWDVDLPERGATLLRVTRGVSQPSTIQR
jgi:hypothetical protein